MDFYTHPLVPFFRGEIFSAKLTTCTERYKKYARKNSLFRGENVVIKLIVCKKYYFISYRVVNSYLPESTSKITSPFTSSRN